MADKEGVLEAISKMPEESTVDDIGYEAYVIGSIQEGLSELGKKQPAEQQAADKKPAE